MKTFLSSVKRFLLRLKRPSKAANARRLKQRGEHLESLVIREATRDDIPALAALHVKAHASDDLPGYAGELNKIYLLREYQRLGVGRRLVGHVARRFLSRGITTMVLFGIPENPSCAFHEALGGERLYAKNGAFHGGYGWSDLNKVAAICPIEPPQNTSSFSCRDAP